MSASPNTWAKATIKNDWGSLISNVELHHRYDNDHKDDGSWDSLENGQTGETFNIGYWTGFMRTGYDYWIVKFEVDGKIWTCKDNFYCFLTGDDQGGTVVCRIYKDGGEGKMDVICPQSSSATVGLSSGETERQSICDGTLVPDDGICIVPDHSDSTSSLSSGKNGPGIATAGATGSTITNDESSSKNIETIRILLHDFFGDPMENVPYWLEIAGRTENGNTADGWVESSIPVDQCVNANIRWGTPDDEGNPPYSQALALNCNSGTEQEEVKAKLQNLAYDPENSYENNIKSFQHDYQIPGPSGLLSNGTLPDETKTLLWAIYTDRACNAKRPDMYSA